MLSSHERLSLAAVGRLTDLPPPEQFVIWAVRMWVLGHRKGYPVRGKLRQGFARIGAPTGAVWLDSLFATMAEGLSRSMVVHCTCDRRTSGDEHALLDMIAACQHEPGHSPAALAELVEPRLRHVVGPLLSRFAETLADAGILMSPGRLAWTAELALIGQPVQSSRMVH